VRPSGKRFVLDGNHRLAAYRALGVTQVRAVVADVDVDDPTDLYVVAARANMRHGLPLSRADLRVIIEALLMRMPDASDREIARRIGCSHVTVGRVRKSLGLSDGVRVVERGGKQYVMTLPRTSSDEDLFDDDDSPPVSSDDADDGSPVSSDDAADAGDWSPVVRSPPSPPPLDELLAAARGLPDVVVSRADGDAWLVYNRLYEREQDVAPLAGDDLAEALRRALRWPELEALIRWWPADLCDAVASALAVTRGDLLRVMYHAYMAS
jgi:hypothetical protein